MAERHVAFRRAPAKINLGLSVFPPVSQPPQRRGWHPIEGLFAALDFADDVTIRPAAEPSLHVRWAEDAPLPTPVDWPTHRDLAWCARQSLESATRRELPCRIDVAKRIGPGAGLGGGSSDAAAVLLALDELFALGLGTRRLAEIGQTLGSDVGFFIDDEHPPRPAIVSGFGDRIERLGRLHGGVLLLLPPVRSHTPEVYRAFDRLGAPQSGFDPAAARSAAAAGSPRGLSLDNALGEAALGESEALREFYLEVSVAASQPPAITGSGSAMYYLDFELQGVDVDALIAVAQGAGGAAVRTRLV